MYWLQNIYSLTTLFCPSNLVEICFSVSFVVEWNTSWICHLFFLYKESFMLKVINQLVYNRMPDILQLHITSLIGIINLKWRNGRHVLNEQGKKKKVSLAIFWKIYHQKTRIYGQEEMVHFLKNKYFITAINHQVRDMSKKKISVTHHLSRTIQELILCTKQALCWQTIRTCQCNMLPSYWLRAPRQRTDTLRSYVHIQLKPQRQIFATF